MRRRRSPPEEYHNRERWLISYADFVTLLFGFFVVMYAISSVNEAKYERLSQALSGVFSVTPRAQDPIQIGELAEGRFYPIAPIVVDGPDADPSAADTHDMETLEQAFTQAFADMVGDGVMAVERAGNWLRITLPNSVLFDAGSADPHIDAFAVIEPVAEILQDNRNAIMVEGHTDNLPIRTDRYPTNWELSAARASAAVRMLAIEGIAPERMAAVGYGEHHPIARNDTAAGRRQNRRVVLLISADSDMSDLRGEPR